MQDHQVPSPEILKKMRDVLMEKPAATGEQIGAAR
jgi:hypothetical protein